jgi:hypothetical protein
MDGLVADGFSNFIAERMQAEHQTLASRWLERLNAVLPVDEKDVFPTHDLLDHIPSLIAEIAAYLRDPEHEEFVANASVVAKARELGGCDDQRVGAPVAARVSHLAGILATFVREEALQLDTREADEAISLLASPITR